MHLGRSLPAGGQQVEWTEKFYDMLQNKVRGSVVSSPGLHALLWQAIVESITWYRLEAASPRCAGTLGRTGGPQAQSLSKLALIPKRLLQLIITNLAPDRCIAAHSICRGRAPANDDEKTQLIDTLQDWKSEKYQACASVASQ
jgi:hypothetical protein